MAAKTWDELYGDKAEKEQPIETALTAFELEKMEDMSREELIALLRLCNARQIAYAMLTKEEKRERLKMKVYGIAMESDNDSVILKAANDWLDREDGKAAQMIKQETTVSGAIAMIGPDEVKNILSAWLGSAAPALVIENAALDVSANAVS